MSKAKRIAKMTIKNIEWSDDSRRVEKKCMKCKQPTTGRVGREPRCMDCTVRHALSPLAGLVDLLTRVANQ